MPYLTHDIIDDIDFKNVGFIDAVIRSIEIERIDGTNLVVDQREKKRIDRYWN